MQLRPLIHFGFRGRIADIERMEQVSEAFDVEQIPYMVIVDRKGQIRHLHLGQVSERTLRSEIDALLDE